MCFMLRVHTNVEMIQRFLQHFWICWIFTKSWMGLCCAEVWPIVYKNLVGPKFHLLKFTIWTSLYKPWRKHYGPVHGSSQNKLFYFAMAFLHASSEDWTDCYTQWQIFATVSFKGNFNHIRHCRQSRVNLFAWSGRKSEHRWHLILQSRNDLIPSATTET